MMTKRELVRLWKRCLRGDRRACLKYKKNARCER